MNELHDPPAAEAGVWPGPARDALCAALVALDVAERQPNPALRCQALTHVGRCYREAGAPDHAEWYWQQSLALARALRATDAMVELMCELAEIAVLRAEGEHSDSRSAHAARERARDLGFEATRLATRATDAHWEVSVLLRISHMLDRCGDHDDAAALQCRALNRAVNDERAVPPACVPRALM